MNTTEIANELIALCNAGENMKAIDTLYASDAASIEPNEPMKEVHGIEAIKGKSAWWMENHEVHSRASRGPWVNGDEFAVEFTYDITFKPTGKRTMMNEIAMYTVRDGKIAQDKFYYAV